mgnify:FL=1
MRNNEDNQTTFGIILVIGFTIMGPVMDTFAKLAANEIPIGQISFSRFFIPVSYTHLTLPTKA